VLYSTILGFVAGRDMASTIAIAATVTLGTVLFSLVAPRRLRPEVAARLLTLLSAVAAAAFIWMLALIALASIVQLHGVAERLASWCDTAVGQHRGTLSPLGAVALAGLSWIAYSVGRVMRRYHRVRAPHGEDRALVVVRSEVPSAFALPGRPGRIVVSSAMLHALDTGERRALLAHERAHLRCRHHRYVRMTEVAAAVLPLLKPMNRRVCIATERWADEEAAAEIGDRAVVARAVARAAIATQSPHATLSMGEQGVIERVHAMLDNPPAPVPILELGTLAIALAAAGALATSVALIVPSIAHLAGLC
jgi:hypothetical protein